MEVQRGSEMIKSRWEKKQRPLKSTNGNTLCYTIKARLISGPNLDCQGVPSGASEECWKVTVSVCLIVSRPGCSGTPAIRTCSIPTSFGKCEPWAEPQQVTPFFSICPPSNPFWYLYLNVVRKDFLKLPCISSVPTKVHVLWEVEYSWSLFPMSLSLRNLCLVFLIYTEMARTAKILSAGCFYLP